MLSVVAIRSRLLLFGIVALALACSNSVTNGGNNPIPQPGPDTTRIPLTDLGPGTYKGFTGGLYPNGSNLLPAAHAARGLTAARAIRPLDVNGQPSANGKYVLMSMGMSNTSQEFCVMAGTVCNAWTFSGKAAADPAVNHTTLYIANGAAGGQTAELWDHPNDANYNRVRDQVLVPAGLSEAQVQILWLQAVRRQPDSALPNADADAYILLGWLGDVVRAAKTRYPNLRQIFVSSRTYAGFATTTFNPEPYAYETGFAKKWLVEAQIKQLDGGSIECPCR